MKRIFEILILLAVIASVASLTGCEDERKKRDKASEAEVHEQVSYERELRTSAESRAQQAASKQSYLRGIALLLFIGTLAAFVGGTALGSKAKHDVERS